MIKIGIIGSGWYGCHIAYELIRKGYHVNLFEKEGNIFAGASGNNTNRLHGGFHYPRAKSTRLENNLYLDIFQKKYPQFLLDKKHNIYGISSIDSLLDWETYKDILSASHLKFQEIHAERYGFQNLQGALLCEEYFIDFPKARAFFMNELQKFIFLNTPVYSLTETENNIIINNHHQYDLVIDCSYSSFSYIHNLNVRYELIQLPILKGLNNDRELSFVIMDGDFQSLTPYSPLANHYTLYDVEFSSIIKSNNLEDIRSQASSYGDEILHQREMIEKACFYYKDFDKKYQIVGKISTIRATHNNKDANRSLLFDCNSRLIKIFSGKISSIFQAEEYILNFLREFR